jgi:hypothetical protein
LVTTVTMAATTAVMRMKTMMSSLVATTVAEE